MKKLFLLLSAGALLAACNSGYQADGPDQVNAAKDQKGQHLEAAMNNDSAAATSLGASANQEQIDTATSHIGTKPTGGPGPNSSPGAKLIAASDCSSCHRDREKLLGPAYTAIAQKYPATAANVTMLAGHIIKGGAGHWGDVPMTPHPGLSESDAKAMVQYVLALK